MFLKFDGGNYNVEAWIDNECGSLLRLKFFQTLQYHKSNRLDNYKVEKPLPKPLAHHMQEENYPEGTYYFFVAHFRDF